MFMFFLGPETEKPADLPGTCRAGVKAGPGNTAGNPRTGQAACPGAQRLQ